MIFVESTIFTKNVSKYLDQEEYRIFQNYLLENANLGDVIQGTGGLRKIRWSAKHKGKRGGVRVIYYREVTAERIYLLTIYAKNEIKDLSSSEKKVLRKLIEGEYDGK